MAHHRYRRVFISESSVYRILNGFDMLSSLVFMMVSAKDKYGKPTKRVQEVSEVMWAGPGLIRKMLENGFFMIEELITYIMYFRASELR